MKISGNSMTVSGAKHTLKSGNKMTAVAYQIDDGKALAYYEYDSAENEIKEKAELWELK